MVIKKQNNTLEFQWPDSSNGGILEGMEITDHILRKKREKATMMKEFSCKNKWIFFWRGGGGEGAEPHCLWDLSFPTKD